MLLLTRTKLILGAVLLSFGLCYSAAMARSPHTCPQPTGPYRQSCESCSLIYYRAGCNLICSCKNEQGHEISTTLFNYNAECVPNTIFADSNGQLGCKYNSK